MGHARLNGYDYDLSTYADSSGKVMEVEIRIKIDSPSDIDVADIATEITANNGILFVDGYFIEKRHMWTTRDTLYILGEVKRSII